MPRPTGGEYGNFYQRYIDYVQGDDARLVLERSLQPLQQFLASIPREKSGYRYAPGKWSVLQVLQHAIDSERIFSYRALCVSRGETQPLPGFEQNDYADHAPATNRTLEDLTEEFILVRRATLLLYQFMSDEALFLQGTASGYPVTPNALAFIIVGHALHHQKILEERYFNPAKA